MRIRKNNPYNTYWYQKLLISTVMIIISFLCTLLSKHIVLALWKLCTELAVITIKCRLYLDLIAWSNIKAWCKITADINKLLVWRDLISFSMYNWIQSTLLKGIYCLQHFFIYYNLWYHHINMLNISTFLVRNA